MSQKDLVTVLLCNCEQRGIMKVLTIAVPAYNAENYIRKCLDSFLGVGEFSGRISVPDERLEVLVVNDGSKDSTAEIASEYEKKYGTIIRLVNKENGGHGSVINKASEIAEGRYFKVIDSDDWIDTGNLKSILDKLESADAEAVITSYKSIDESTGSIQDYSNPEELSDRIMDMKEFAELFDQIPSSYQFHGICYRTDFYKGLSLKLTERVSYEDQEYAILPFIKVEHILFLKEMFYIYRLGSEGQTVNYANQAKKLGDMETVIKRMVHDHVKAKESEDWTEDREFFFTKRLSMAAVSYYAAALVKSGDKKEGLLKAQALRDFLMAEDKNVAEYSEARFNTLKRAGKIPGLAGVYKAFSGSKAYKNFKKKWVK